MRLLDFVEEDDRVRFAADSFGQLATLVVAHVSRRGTDQTCRAELLLVFAHVDTRHHVLIIKQIVSQRLGQLRLTHTRGTEEDERTDRPLRVLETGTAAADSIGDGGDSLVLADDTLVEFLLEVEQLLALALQHLAHGDTRPARNHIGDIVAINLLLDHGGTALHGVELLLNLFDFLLLLFDFAVADFGYFAVVALALGFVGFKFQVLDINLILLNLVDLLLFALPLSLLLRFLFLEVSDFLVQLGELLLVILTLDGLALNLQLLDTAGNLVQGFRHRVHLHTEAGGSFIHQVNRLIRQETVGDVPARKLDGSDDGVILDTHLVMVLVFLLQTTEDGDGIHFARFIDHNNLETTLQRLVLLEILLVFVQGGGTDGPEFAPCEGRLQDVGCVHRAFTLAGTDQRVDFVDEEDNLAVALRNLIDDSLQTLLELSFVLRTGNQRTHIERENLFRLQILRDIATDDTVRQPLGNRRLTDTRLANQDRVVLRTAAQNLEDTADFLVAADDRVEFSAPGTLVQVDSVFVQGVVRILGRLAGNLVALPQLVDGEAEFLFSHARIFQDLRRTALLREQGEEDRLEGNILVAHLRRIIDSLLQDLVGFARQIRLTARNLRQGSYLRIQDALQVLRIDA